MAVQSGGTEWPVQRYVQEGQPAPARPSAQVKGLKGVPRVMGEGPELGMIWKWAQVRAGREPVARVQGGY